ncbi:MAG TPA: DUF4157 domain-containing protein [Candidatus Eisenbacteria bacterium]|nr:DUF4157 domain-containing protein [Candidatus Eisenbacteria bacterium]
MRAAPTLVRVTCPTPSSGVVLQRKCTCGGNGGDCAECRKKREGMVQRFGMGGPPSGVAPPIVHDVLAQPGRPLEARTKARMEDRLGHRFDHVRVHTDALSAKSARAVGALAYTVGSDIVFGSSQYEPGRSHGDRLLAHELAHVVQQARRSSPAALVPAGRLLLGSMHDACEEEADRASRADRGVGAISTHGSPSVQRACGEKDIRGVAPPECGVGDHLFVPGRLFKFDKGCDDFAAGMEGALIAFPGTLTRRATIEIHGYASVDTATYNEELACARTKKARDTLTGPGGLAASRITAMVSHGPTPGPAEERRSVTIVATEPPPLPRCGPDATDWYVNQVNTASKDPAVVSIQRDLARADTLARGVGTSAHQVGEAGATSAVLGQEARLKVTGPAPPPRDPTINSQLAAGAVSTAAAASALGPSPFTAAIVTGLMGKAGLAWRALVNHAARYDFKAHADSMNHPHTTNCPQEGCPKGEVGIITLCPQPDAENCYESDLPGNLFYAQIGRFVGFSELTLQLGSQMAELTDTTPRAARPSVTWDSPQDTAAISLGFGLPVPLTRAMFCAALRPARSKLAQRTDCEDCLDPTPSKIR